MNDDKEWLEIAKVLQSLDDNKDRAFSPVSLPALIVFVSLFAVGFYVIIQIVFFIARLFGG